MKLGKAHPLEVKIVDMWSEREAGGGGIHAILKVMQFFTRGPDGEKVDFPLHRSEATRLYGSLVQQSRAQYPYPYVE